jgi:FlaA1/EpsC-like NDP-sugar epimerase
MLVHEVTQREPDSYDIVMVEGYPVLGLCDDLEKVVAQHKVEEAIIAVPSASREFNRMIMSLCRDAKVPFRIIPGMLEIIKGPVRLEQVRDMRPEDLLGRESVEFDEQEISRARRGRKVRGPGAGGSIGGEICRQISRFELDRLFVLGRGENQIYEIEYQLKSIRPDLEVVPLIADIRDGAALERLFKQVAPHYVYHAAAHKHVHYMESFPVEAVKNNVFGTLNVIESARAAGVERVVMLSTDKAVSPRGIMGATKRIAEYLMISRTGGNENNPRLMTVRFGNVLASRGSVVPLFVRQINSGGPVTVSHQDATRFFMSMKEACMLVVQASIMGEGGEVFVLQMGKPIRIVEVARDLISLHGYRADGDITIDIVGLRPGEKLHEDLVVPGEQAVPSRHEHILCSRGAVPKDVDLDTVLFELNELSAAGDVDGIKRCLARAIPDSEFM